MPGATKRFAGTRELAADLDRGRIHRVYLFLGEEEGEKDKAIKRIIDLVLPDGEARKHSIGRFHMENNEIVEAADFTLSQSMFNADRVCIMHNIDRLSSNQASSAMLKETILTVPDTAKVILTTVEKRPPSFINAALLENIRTIQFWKFFSSDLVKYIAMSMKKVGLEIEEKAIEVLMERTGNDIRSIDEAIEIVKMSGSRGVITAEIITQYVGTTRSFSIFDFIDSLFAKDQKALQILVGLLEDGTAELAVLHMIARQCDLLERYHLVYQEKGSVDAAIQECAILPRNRAKFLDQAQSFSPNRLKKIYPLIRNADAELKSGTRYIDSLSRPVVTLAASILLSG